MSTQASCDYAECKADPVQAFGYALPWMKFGVQTTTGSYAFCSPEHAVLWLFESYPEMPLWYGPKTQVMAEAMNG